MPKLIPHHIGGTQVEGRGRTAAVYNPATGEQTGSVSLASTAEMNEAIAVAREPSSAGPPPRRSAGRASSTSSCASWRSAPTNSPP